MTADHDIEGKPRRSSNRVIPLAILGGCVLIAIGLAIGLGIGLRKSCENNSLPVAEEQTGESGDERVDCSQPSSTYKSGTGSYRFAAVTAKTSLCSQIGTQFLARKNGNAVDATVATVICDGVMHAQSHGIGGGAFIIFYNRTERKIYAINAREMAPRAANETMFVSNPELSVKGGLAIGVPGELAGLWALHEKYGRVPWRDLLQPTIDLCIKGHPLEKSHYNAAVREKDSIVNNPEFSYLFNEQKEVLPIDSIIKRPKLAETLKNIANEGISAFYNGILTDSIVEDIADAGGIITREDLKSYQPDFPTPITLNLAASGVTAHSMPPPGSGVVLEFILNILEGYNLSADSVSTTEKSILTYHRIAEAMKFAYAKRSHLGDEKFLNISELVANLTSSKVGEEIRARINDSYTQKTSYYEPDFQIKDDQGTSHFSIMDSEGNAVAITSTVNVLFGSKVKGNRTGIIFNNQMNDFSTPNTTDLYGVPPSPSNFIVPGKRPMSSMTPTIFTDNNSGDVKIVIGGSGGTRITTSVALVAVKALWFNSSIFTAVDDPRIHHQLLPSVLNIENDFPQAIKSGLTHKGHTLEDFTGARLAAIHHSNGKVEAVMDWRNGGRPDGY